MTIAGLVLAAGSSRRLGQPKQLLEFRGRTLLDASLDVARATPFDRRLATIGGAGPEVLEQVDFTGFELVESVHHTKGCSSSIVSALTHLDDEVEGFVLMLGDQPGVDPDVIELVISEGRSGRPIVVCKYTDGIGHPFWFDRSTFAALGDLHGDKAVWKVIESGEFPVHEVSVAGTVPLDVDTWDDYEHLLAVERAKQGAIQ